MNQLPLARSENIVVQELGKELLIYDLKTNKAYCLNQTSALIYQSCDGKSSAAGISRKLTKKLNALITEDLIWLAIDQLKKDNLLDNSDVLESRFDNLSRREIIRKIGVSSMIALPMISSLIAPTAAMAQSAASACGTACTCNGGGAVYYTNTFCTEPSLTCAPGCQCFALTCPGDTNLPCTGECRTIV